jgi:hypothetical protein
MSKTEARQHFGSVEDLRAGGCGSALNIACQLPNALSGIPQASQYLLD